MNVGSRLAGYAHVLRKHVVVLIVAVVLVGAAGVVYLVRQEPRYEAEALLRIEQPVQNVMGGVGGRNWFAISQAALNTELYLLRKETATAERALEQLRADGLDPSAAGYTPSSLSSSVSVAPIPATEGLVRFSLQGGDAATLPAVVNAYARAYADSTIETRTRTFSLQRAALERDREKAAGLARVARDALAKYRAAHDDVDLDRGENPAAQERALLAAQIPDLERQALADALAEQRIRDALAETGIRVDTAGGEIQLLVDETATLVDALADSPFVAGLGEIRSNPEVQRLRTEERAGETRDRELDQQGIRPAHEQRAAIRAAISGARSLRARVIETTLAGELRGIAARAAHLASTRTSEEDAAAEEERLAAILSGFRACEREVADRERELAEAAARLDGLTSTFLTGAATAGTDGGDAPSAEQTLRIELRVPATVARQIAPRTSMIVILTLCAALATGLGLAFVLEFLDDTVRSKEDFDRYLGLPLLGFVPRISSSDYENPDLASDARPGTAVAEAFRAIRTSILFSRGDHQVRSLIVTSAGPGEGKTTVGTNLAAAFARQKGPVLLIDADLRKPRVARALGLENERGLTNILVGEATLDDVVRETSVDGLYVVTSGPIPPNPAELLHGEAMAELMKEAGERYERVILDTPPLVAVTDARVLAGQVDGFYLVISMGQTSRRLILRALESLASIGCGVDGAVLNNTSAVEGRYGDYFETYGGDYRQR